MIRTTLVVVAVALIADAATAAEVRFAAIGDLPYNDAQRRLLASEIAPALRRSGAAFLVHYGDFKGGGVACTPGDIGAARRDMERAFDGPVHYTPGDNDWTDCDRGATGAPVSELARLDMLRRGLFADDPVGGTASVARQPLFPENARWHAPADVSEGAVVFATLHVVGTNNGRMQVLEDDVDLALALVEARDQANRVWLEAALADARSRKAGALVVAMQADITDPGGSGPCTALRRIDCDAFLPLRAQLRDVARRFGGPMLVIHGDTSPYCLDKGFGGDAAPNLWRLNGTGDYAVVDAMLVTVDAANRDTPFAVHTLVRGLAPAVGCG